MNERIKELWEQCKTPDWHQDNPTYDHEKFAELIVRECAGVCHTYGWGMLEHGRPGNSIADDCGVLIKQHFGVEG